MTQGTSEDRAFKSTSIPEIGEIPAHWTVQPQRHAYAQVLSGNWGDAPTLNDPGVPCIRVGDFDDDTLRLKRRPRARRIPPPSGDASRTIPLNTLLLERSGGDAQRAVGKVVLYDRDEEAISSNYIVELHPKAEFDPTFLLFQHFELYATGRVRRAAPHQSGIQNLDIGAYLNEPVTVPPPTEQVAIGQSLNKAHTRQRALIERRRAQRALLQERWTRYQWERLLGRSEEHPLTGPPLHALDALPKGWSTRKLSSLMDIRAGAILPSTAFGHTGVPIVRLSDIEDGEINTHNKRVKAAQVPQSAWAEHGDVLVTLSSRISAAPVVSSTPVAVNQRVAILHPNDGADAFLTAFVCSPVFETQLARTNASNTNILNVSMPSLRNVRVPWPTRALRNAVGNELAAARKTHRQLLAAIDRSIVLSHEHFVALVHQQVLGRDT